MKDPPPHVSQAALSPGQPQDGEACVRKCPWDILVRGPDLRGEGPFKMGGVQQVPRGPLGDAQELWGLQSCPWGESGDGRGYMDTHPPKNG